MAEKKENELQKIKELVEMMVAKDLIEIEIVDGDNKILIKRPQPQQQGITAIPAAAPPVVAPPAGPVPAAPSLQLGAEGAKAGLVQGEQLVEIKSPMVGTFYETPSPDSEPFVQVGSDVDPETVVCIIEAMKVMNEIKAEVTGTIAEIMVANGQAIEYGQVLFKVKPR